MLLIVVSLLLYMFSRVFTKHANAMKKWPTTPGRIIQSYVTTTLQRHRRPYRSSGDYNVTMYVPRIVYSYDVGGHAYQGDEVGWSTTSNRQSVADKQVKRYPLGTEVRVFYNPDNPAEATLSTSIGMLPVIFWVLSGLAAAGAVTVGWLLP